MGFVCTIVALLRRFVRFSVPESQEVKYIRSHDNSFLIDLRKQIKNPALYRQTGRLWLEGEHLCQVAASRGLRITHALISEPGWEQPDLRALVCRAGTVLVLSDSLMAKLSSLESPAPVGFVVCVPVQHHLDDTMATIILDRLQDPGNVGTILRTAAAFGFQQIMAIKGTVALWSPKVLRAGMGAHFNLRLLEWLDPESLQGLNVPILLSSPHATETLHHVSIPWPCAWVIGHEGQGVADNLARYAQHQLRIPQPGGEESLNAAIAASICFYETVRSRI